MGMLDVGVSALLTTQGSLTTTSHNISNANTEGYNRQRIDQTANAPSTSGGHYIGTGVNISGISRVFDQFLAAQARIYTAQEAEQDTFLHFASQVDDLLASPELGINSSLESLFNAVHEVANDPTSTAARQTLLTEGEILAGRFNALDQQLTEFGKQIDDLLATSIQDINTLTKGIAELNEAIATTQASSVAEQPNDLLDKRDLLITELAKFVSVNVLTDSSGMLNVFVGNGQALVMGTDSVNLHEITNTVTDPARTGIGYGLEQTDITAQLSGGSIGGALHVREQVIDATQTELDELAQAITTHFNAHNRKGVDLNGTIGGELFAVPALPNTVDAGSIRLAITDPNAIAAAFPVGVSHADLTTTPASLASGTGRVNIASIDAPAPLTLPLLATNIQLSFNATTNQYTVDDGVNPAVVIAYDPKTDSGKSIALTSPMAELTLKLTGVPEHGDIITITNSTSTGDNRNALALADLQVSKILSGDTKTLAEFYGVTISNVASRTHQADISQQTQQELLDQVQERQERLSGVNLDEEAANLIKFQQSYQAASQIISVSNTIFNALINAI